MRCCGRAVFILALTLAAGCAGSGGGSAPNVDAARNFENHPLYWVGERFEEWS